MRVVSWNMNHWQQSRGSARRAAEAWEYLRNSLDADLALVQEAALPTGIDPYSTVGQFTGHSGRAWGTGIVDLTGVGCAELKSVTYPDRKTYMPLAWTVPGAAAAAVIKQGSAQFTAVALYGQFVGGSSYGTMLHHAGDLAPLLNDPSLSRRVLIAGDFNLNAQWVDSNAWYNRLEETIIDTLTMWGLRDLIAESDLASAPECRCGRDVCRYVQTYWRTGSATPWQNDHALASTQLPVHRVWVNAAAVLDHRLSDHAPLVLEVDL